MVNRIINIVFILVGGGIALYANPEEDQNEYLLIFGVVILMIGLYRLSKGIRGNKPVEPLVKFEDEEE